MSRRPNPAADRAAQNQQTLKSLVKLEANKSCADCKRNKHPRWASWNLGVFICIRCSGIHRGMGTHISRVKSVDLDTWTDEQLQSMLRWGNARANKYWEAKLAPGHIPSESKIENFIRTKYDSKRWVMDGPMPDPATLDTEGDDDVPLNVVQEKAKLERSASQRAASNSSGPQRRQAPAAAQQTVDLIGGDEPVAAPARPSTTGPAVGRPPPKADAAPPKQTKPGDSLLGLDFFGTSTSAPSRPASITNPSPSMPSRPDLKQSILSLYASAPKPVPQPQPQQIDAFGGLASPTMQSPTAAGGLGGLNDAFSSLSFASPAAPAQPKPSPFADLLSSSSARSSPKPSTSSTFGGGGSFFDTLSQPSSKATSPPPHNRTFSSNSGFGDFSSLASAATSTASKPATTAPGAMGDLFDFSMPSKPTAQAPKPTSPSYTNSPFNLSNPAPASQPQPKPTPAAVPNIAASLSGMDPWGSNDAWASSNTTAAQPAPAPAAATARTTTLDDDFGGWGSAAPAPAKPISAQITQDDDFGGWSSAPPASSKPAAPVKPLAGADDLFSNVWE